MSEVFYATSPVCSKGSALNRNASKLNRMVSGTTIKRSVKTDLSPKRQAERCLTLNEFLDLLEVSTHPEAQPSVRYLRKLLTSLDGCTMKKCIFDTRLLKAHVELEANKKHTESLHFRATNALHLSGFELQSAKTLCFEAGITYDGILLTGVTGLTVSVNVLKGTSRCDVLQARIQSTKENCILKLKIRSPLTGQTTDDDFALVDLEADLSGDNETCQSKEEQLREKRQKAQHLRTTATGMKSLSLSDLVSHTVSTVVKKDNVLTVAINDNVSPLPTDPRIQRRETILMIIGISMALFACYMYIMTKVPFLVPLIVTLSAISFFLLSFERRWRLKSKLAMWVNVVSMTLVVVKLVLIS